MKLNVREEIESEQSIINKADRLYVKNFGRKDYKDCIKQVIFEDMETREILALYYIFNITLEDYINLVYKRAML